MSSKWPKKRLAEIAEVITGFPFKGDMYLPPKHGVRVVRGDNVTERYVRWGEKEKCWTGVSADLKHYLLRTGDVVIGMDGSKVGKNFAAISAEDDGVLLAQRVARVRAREGVNQDYLRYLICNDSFTEYVKAVQTGTSIPHISKGQIEDFPVNIPLLKVQCDISEILTSLDDRITLLRETNATLEAIAQALFKSWFVDFDPVRAKMEGRAPVGMDEATAALFPDLFQESELGLVPKGWAVSTLGQVTSQYGGAIQTGPFGSQLHASDYAEHGTPVAMPKDIADRRINTASVARVPAQHVIRLARHKLAAGDIVFSRRGDVERHALVTSHEVGWLCGTGCLLVRPGPQWRWSAYLSMLLDAPHVKVWLVQHAVGATMPNLNTGILASVPLVLPPEGILDSFEQVAMAIEERRSENLATGRSLADLRDTLLPRLISGQMRLPEAKTLLEEALT